MAELLGLDVGAGLKMPSLGGVGSGMTNILLWGGVVLVVAITIAIFFWIWFQNKMYNKKVAIFENIGGLGYQKTGEDVARLIKIGDGGEEILFLKNRKSYKTAYGKKMGTNVYWFAVGQDGYWYNCTLGDLDAKMGMLDIEPVDRDMRYMHVAIRKNISDNYKKKESFMDKYGSMVMNSIFLLIMLLGLWFIADKVAGGIKELVVGLKNMEASNELMKQALAQVQTTCQGGSGYIRV
jgi:hypothetical protein